MAREFQVLVRDPSGAVSSVRLQSGESIRVESKQAYRIVVDDKPELPDDTRIFSDGRHLKIRLADGAEITPLAWATRSIHTEELPYV